MAHHPTQAAGSGQNPEWLFRKQPPTQWVLERHPHNAFILRGQQGSGKSQYAEALAQALGCSRIVDDWSALSPIFRNALHLTNEFTPPPTVGWVTRHILRLRNWRILLQRTSQRHDCPQCHGHGMWRPPYKAERVPCDLCTSAPISQASATTVASVTPSDSRA